MFAPVFAPVLAPASFTSQLLGRPSDVRLECLESPFDTKQDAGSSESFGS